VTNDEMKAGRFARLARARRVWKFIQDNAVAGRTTYAANYLSAVKLTPKAVLSGAIRLSGSHVEVARGRHWDSLNGCKFTAR